MVVVVRTCCNARVSSRSRARVRVGASAPIPSAEPFSSEGRFQASPVQTSSNPKPRKKIARHAHLFSSPEDSRGSNLFHRLSVGCLGLVHNDQGMLGRVFIVNRTRLPMLLLQSRRLSGNGAQAFHPGAGYPGTPTDSLEALLMTTLQRPRGQPM